ncbi:MAG: class I SAM-dependent methyltransferase [Desulfovibrionaceae bacterium]
MGRRCPICDSSNKSHISVLCDTMKILGSSFPESSSNNVECSACGCVYVDMEAVQDNFTTYYRAIAKSISYNTIFGKENTNTYYGMIWTALEKYVQMHSCKKEDIAILDVGCGFGEFIEYLQNRGYCNVQGVELSEECVSKAKEKGLRVTKADIVNEEDCIKDQFDIIIFSHVGEHIVDFKKAIENLKKLLNNDGYLYMEFPDARKYCDVDFGAYFFTTYEHVMHVTDKTLQNIALVHSLTLLSFDTYQKLDKYYVIFGIYKKSFEEKTSSCFYDTTAKEAFMQYEAFSQVKIPSFVKELEESQEEIILWGIGASTAILLSKVFHSHNVIYLIDSNTQRQGIVFCINNKKVSVEAPSAIQNSVATIVVLPEIYGTAIKKELYEAGYKNNVLLLSM